MSILTDSVRAFAPAGAVQRIEKASRRVQQPQSSGDLVSLAMGEPGFSTPSQIVEAAATSLRDGRTHYSPLLGESSLRGALSERLSALSSVEARPGDIVVTHGGTAGLAASILSIVNPGDRVVIPDPTYSLYADVVSMAGGVVVPVPLADNLHWDIDELRNALAGARLFIFCNPVNPTGIVHSRDELLALATMLSGTDTVVISDEAYADLTFTDAPFTSAVEITALRERTIYCQTFSKSYAMTGWRVGYLWGPSDLIRGAARIHNTFNGSVNTAVQDAALAALRTAGPDVENMREAYARRGQLMKRMLSEIPGLELSNVEGAFYQFPRYDFDMPSVDVVAGLRERGVAVRPGSEFGEHGEYHLRLSYAASEQEIEAGVERLADGIRELGGECSRRS
ncbi:pyridoxal phosphate-dependent aminotransferase [Paramicrobacterium chengjingii]|uniref:Aminotransferase class I/II-fold pyridoxal phosphate-dependent enzyme n=1 Tax=Paramicrobacterium chengjingii TaxID=2769067 RepID=A0ABX6YHA3_9MICO|nr:aminotransferase class I/II-fold pyridoxal phosphate-dependent enzyme [Microbacterium chengjingii]QPZ38168.1 aminotransferase class I/II-fold pyridoxal phosphate-dependent enzyme [Microbacterium chengjingii]